MRETDGRNFDEVEQPRRSEPTVAFDEDIVFVDGHGVVEAELADGGRNLPHLGCAVGARVAVVFADVGKVQGFDFRLSDFRD